MLANGNQDIGTGKAREFVTMTFRIDKKIIDSFRKESDSSGISMNALVNQVLCHYVEWDSYGLRIGMIPFPKTIL